MKNLLVLALAPVLIGLFYMYIRDKYEKEPIRLLLLGLACGVAMVYPIIQTENYVASFMPISTKLFEAFYVSFLVAALVEEGFKFLVLFIISWRQKQVNEPMDGIVYAVFISLGFAGLENIMYVFNPEIGGLETALLRAVFSVPAHGLFGVTMGYYFAMAKFEKEHKMRHLFLAIVVTWFVHGCFDFILLANLPCYWFVFVPFVAFLWWSGFKKIKIHLENSPFKTHGS